MLPYSKSRMLADDSKLLKSNCWASFCTVLASIGWVRWAFNQLDLKARSTQSQKTSCWNMNPRLHQLYYGSAVGPESLGFDSIAIGRHPPCRHNPLGQDMARFHSWYLVDAGIVSCPRRARLAQKYSDRWGGYLSNRSKHPYVET